MHTTAHQQIRPTAPISSPLSHFSPENTAPTTPLRLSPINAEIPLYVEGTTKTPTKQHSPMYFQPQTDPFENERPEADMGDSLFSDKNQEEGEEDSDDIEDQNMNAKRRTEAPRKSSLKNLQTLIDDMNAGTQRSYSKPLNRKNLYS